LAFSSLWQFGKGNDVPTVIENGQFIAEPKLENGINKTSGLLVTMHWLRLYASKPYVVTIY